MAQRSLAIGAGTHAVLERLLDPAIFAGVKRENGDPPAWLHTIGQEAQQRVDPTGKDGTHRAIIID